MDMSVRPEVAKKAVATPNATAPEPRVAPDGDDCPETGSSTRITRLLCARAYFYGLYGSLGALHQICGPAFHAQDPGVGFNRRLVALHCVQSILLSIVTLVVVAGVLAATPAKLSQGEASIFFWLALALLFVKIAVVNPFIARRWFRETGAAADLAIPLVSPAARTITRWVLPEADATGTFVSYFAGDRPFVGYGTEISAWTIVLNTSVPAPSITDLAGTARDPKPLAAADLYQAILRGASALCLEGLRIGWQVFVDGRSVDAQKRKTGERYRRPVAKLPHREVALLDREGSHGRRYMSLTMTKPGADLITNQFIRFRQNGKLIFCEFATYVLAPAAGNLYRLDRFFQISWVLYGLIGVGSFVGIAVLADVALFVLGMVLPPFDVTGDQSLFLMQPEALPEALRWTLANAGFTAHALVIVAALFIAAFVAWRVARTALSFFGILFNVTRQFGVAYSFRERFTSRGQLDYFPLQEVARFMKTQEKILTCAICDQLKEHQIDASDFKESLTAYVNQGVINSGDIRGDVMSSIKSFVFRHPARSATGASRARHAGGR